MNYTNESTPDKDNRKDIYQGTLVLSMASIPLPSTCRHVFSVIAPADKTKRNLKLLEFAGMCGFANSLPDEWKDFQFLSCDYRYAPCSNGVEDSAAGDSVSSRAEAEPVFEACTRGSDKRNTEAEYDALSMNISNPVRDTFDTRTRRRG